MFSLREHPDFVEFRWVDAELDLGGGGESAYCWFHGEQFSDENSPGENLPKAAGEKCVARSRLS